MGNTTKAFALVALLSASFQLAPAQGTADPQGRWQEFTSVEGRFVVKFPGTPSERATSTLHLFSVRTRFGEYLVSYTDGLPEQSRSASQTFFDKARHEMVAQGRGAVVSERDLSLGAHPGRELVLRAPGEAATILKTRTYLVGRRMYQLIVVQPDPSATDPRNVGYYNMLADVFFKSFALTTSSPKS